MADQRRRNNHEPTERRQYVSARPGCGGESFANDRCESNCHTLSGKVLLAPQIGQLLSRLPEQRILVVGDLILDEDIIGESSRISREAPVPVVRYGAPFSEVRAIPRPTWRLCEGARRWSACWATTRRARRSRLLTERLCQALISTAHAAGKPVIIDPDRHASSYANCDYLKPNGHSAGFSLLDE